MHKYPCICQVYNKDVYNLCEMHIKGNQTSLASFILIIQYIEDTKDPFWDGLATRVPKWCAKRVG